MGLGCLLAACINMQVDAYAGPPTPPEAIYQVAPATKDGWSDLQFQEFAGETRNALSAAGYKVAERPEQIPEVVVIIDYGVGPPQSTSMTSSSTNYAWVNKGGGTATVRPMGGGAYAVQSQPLQSYEPVGESTETITRTTYRRRFIATAIDYPYFQKTHELKQLWKVSVESQGAAGDLRSVLPALIAGAQPYFGKSSGKQVSVTLSPKDPQVEVVRTGAPAPAK